MKRSATLVALIAVLSLSVWPGSSPSGALKDPCPPTGTCACTNIQWWPCAPEGASRECLFGGQSYGYCVCTEDANGIERWNCT